MAAHLHECEKLQDWMESERDYSYPRSDYDDFIETRLFFDKAAALDARRKIALANLSETAQQCRDRKAKEAAALPKPIVAKVVAKLSTAQASKIRISRGLLSPDFLQLLDRMASRRVEATALNGVLVD